MWCTLTDVHTAHACDQLLIQLKQLYMRHVHPRVMKYMAAVFGPVLAWLGTWEVQLFAAQVSAITFGELFWPRSHKDEDDWFTVLICLDQGNGVQGGDFAFPEVGHILKCEHGDILIYNPKEYHGTTEMGVVSEADGRVFGACYFKGGHVHAQALSMALSKRLGVKPMPPQFSFLDED